MKNDDRSLIEAILGDGRPLLALTGLALILSGGFALTLSIRGEFLPHDVAFLGMTAHDLCARNGCRIVHFMFHDRVAFGGSLIAIGSLYLWLVEFPLRADEAWAWWVLVASGLVGFGSFLTYLGYGYLDAWHGVATLFLLPCYLAGLARAWGRLPPGRHARLMLMPGDPFTLSTRLGLGRAALLLTGFGIMGAGAVIMVVGMTTVFVPQDLEFMGLTVEQLRAINPGLIPLIAHDRAGFGGGLFSTGLTIFLIVWKARPSRGLWEILAVAGLSGFGCAIGTHFPIGYINVPHLAPAFAGAGFFIAGMALARPGMMRG